jgi:regulator of nucleoside diphosphate kinase
MSDAHFGALAQRPPIVLTAMDWNRLAALLSTASDIEPGVARFLREELSRAVVARVQVSETSLVTMGSVVKFIVHDMASVQRLRLVYPDEVHGGNAVSVLTPLGSALIGLGPGQSISWREHGTERRLTVLEIISTSNRDQLVPSDDAPPHAGNSHSGAQGFNVGEQFQIRDHVTSTERPARRRKL